MKPGNFKTRVVVVLILDIFLAVVMYNFVRLLSPEWAIISLAFNTFFLLISVGLTFAISITITQGVQRPPGFCLRRLAEFLFSRRRFEEVLEPPLRDLYDEYCEALKDGRIWKARWVQARGYWSFWAAFLAQTPISVVKKIYQIWKAIP